MNKKNNLKSYNPLYKKKYYTQLLFDNNIINTKKIEKLFENEKLYIYRKIITELISSNGIYQYNSIKDNNNEDKSKNSFLMKKTKLCCNSYIIDNFFDNKNKKLERNNVLYINTIEETNDISFHIPFIHENINVERNIFKIDKKSNIEFVYDNIFFKNRENKIENIKNYYFIINNNNVDMDDYLIKEELNELFSLIV